MSKGIHILTWVLLVLGGAKGWAQIPPNTLGNLNEDLDQSIEDAITDFESDDQTDWTIFTDFLNDLRKKPLSLNKATKEDLLLLPGIDQLRATSLLRHIDRFGPLISVYELQAVEGFDPDIFRQIKPFVVVPQAGDLDMDDRMHPAGPPLQKVIQESSHELLYRMISILEEQKGYTAPDTNGDGSLSTRYLGSPYRQYLRYRMRFEQNFSLALVGEKDAGEQFGWLPDQGTFGFDFNFLQKS